MAVLVGKAAPDFTANAVLGNNEISNITFSKVTEGKYAVVFFYPLDFTFVCPSELIAFDHRLEEFKEAQCRSAWCFYRLPIQPLGMEKHPDRKRRYRQRGLHFGGRREA